jgi:hypothetical protein
MASARIALASKRVSGGVLCVFEAGCGTESDAFMAFGS